MNDESEVSSKFLAPLGPYLEAFAEADQTTRAGLLSQCMTPDAQIWGPKRVFSGYAEISEKIDGFHRNWPGCRLVVIGGINSFNNAARIGSAIVGVDGSVLATGESIIELAQDGRICRVLPFWEAPLSLPESWPRHLAVAESSFRQPVAALPSSSTKPENQSSLARWV